MEYLYNYAMSKAKCLECLDIMESKHQNDFVVCKCKESFLDGGDGIIRAGGKFILIDENKRVTKDNSDGGN